MIDLGKKNVLGVRLDAVDYDAAVDKILKAARAREPLAVSALAVHGVMTGVLDEVHLYRLNELDLLVPDGQPVRWAMNMLYDMKLRDRVYGPTLMLRVCERASREALPIYLYGSHQAVLDALCAKLRTRFPELIIAGTQPSRFRKISPEERQEVARQIRDSGAAITFVGLGCPRQEVWVYEYRDVLPMPLIAVGAAFDFHAGNVEQAPALLQRHGLEWLYRLGKEPRRLWKRYVILNPLYVGLVAMQLLRLVRFERKNSRPRIPDIRYG